MSDPLSVAAGVVGIVTAAAQISSLLIKFTKTVKDAPRQAILVLTEVNDTSSILAQLQPFLLGLETPEQSRTCLIQVESVIAILTGCVATFSELQGALDSLEYDEMRPWDRVKWSRKESAIAALLTRLQTHKASLSLILTILNANTMHEVKISVDAIKDSMQQNYQEILARVRGLEDQQAKALSHVGAKNSTNSSLSNLQESQKSTSGSSRVFNHLFEMDLAFTRVYKKIRFSNSTASIFTTDRPETRWSAISGPSIADIVSNISVYELAITPSELFNPQQYISPDQVGHAASRIQSTSSSNASLSHLSQSSRVQPPAPLPGDMATRKNDSNDQELLEFRVDRYVKYLVDHWDLAFSINTDTLFGDIMYMLGIRPSDISGPDMHLKALKVGSLPDDRILRAQVNSVYVPWHQLYIIGAGSKEDFTWTCYLCQPEDRPLSIYRDLLLKGQRPTLSFRSSIPKLPENGQRDLVGLSNGQIVDGFLLDEELFRIYLLSPDTADLKARRVAFHKVFLNQTTVTPMVH